MSEQRGPDQDASFEDSDPTASDDLDPGTLFQTFGYLFLVLGLIRAAYLFASVSVPAGQDPSLGLFLPAVYTALYSVLIFLPLEGLARIINLLAEIRDSGMK